MFGRRKKNAQESKHRITVQTDYGSLEIVNLKSVWINWFLGNCRLMYEDENYNFNCIYWSNLDNTLQYQALKEKLLTAYNNGDSVVVL